MDRNQYFSDTSTLEMAKMSNFGPFWAFLRHPYTQNIDLCPKTFIHGVLCYKIYQTLVDIWHKTYFWRLQSTFSFWRLFPLMFYWISFVNSAIFKGQLAQKRWPSKILKKIIEQLYTIRNQDLDARVKKLKKWFFEPP